MLTNVETLRPFEASALEPQEAVPTPKPDTASPARGVSHGDAIEILGVARVFRDGSGLHATDLTVHAGEFLSVLGPSGCGKSTLLRCVAGLETPDQGRIVFGDRTVYDHERGTFVAPRQRRLGMVFQDLALWPHLSASENVAFPLRVTRTPKHEVTTRVAEALELVGLSHFAEKMPHQLSGGQQQRVAIARAIVARPSLLLMDEPFSALDAALRLQLRDELRELTTSLGLTTIYVTHDQADAMAMSDRIAVLDRGVLKQVSTPEELYLQPHDAFVANFIGRCNWLPGEATVGARPEHVSITGEHQGTPRPGTLQLQATVTACAYTGGSYSISCELPDAQAPWVLEHHARLDPGTRVQVTVAEERLIRIT